MAGSPTDRSNNRQTKYGPDSDWYLHPRKGFKRKRASERAFYAMGAAKLDFFLRAKRKGS